MADLTSLLPSITAFYSALHCLSRFSETFWLSTPSASNRTVRLSAINATNSAFCMFAFDPDFFLSLTTTTKVECSIHLKPLLTILRTRGRTVERLALSLTTEGTCRFTVTLHCHHSILKTHRLTYEPKRGLLPSADPNPPHFFCIHPTTASEWLDHFLSTSKTGEITLHCTPNSCIARSRDDEVVEGKAGGARKSIATEVKVAVEEFKEYAVLDEVKLTFSLREFKATVSLAESWGVAMEVNFDVQGPVFVRLRRESEVGAEFVLATSAGGGEEAQTNDRSMSDATTERRQRQQPFVAASASSHCNHPRPTLAAVDSSTSVSPPHIGTTQKPMPNQSTPVASPPAPLQADDDATQPLFFPGASQLSPHPTQDDSLFVQPTPVSQGGEPAEFLHDENVPHRQSQDDESQTSMHTCAPRKRFKPLF